MTREHEVVRFPRLANVSLALLVGAETEAAPALASELQRIFEDLLVVGYTGPVRDCPGRRIALNEIAERSSSGICLDGIIAALEAAREERVILLATGQPRVTLDLVVALTAWPEHDVIAPREDGQIWEFCALYRRTALLPKCIELSNGAGPPRSPFLVAILEALECCFIEGDDLAEIISAEN